MPCGSEVPVKTRSHGTSSFSRSHTMLPTRISCAWIYIEESGNTIFRGAIFKIVQNKYSWRLQQKKHIVVRLLTKRYASVVYVYAPQTVRTKISIGFAKYLTSQIDYYADREAYSTVGKNVYNVVPKRRRKDRTMADSLGVQTHSFHRYHFYIFY
jgi:hypothetical protein